MQFIFEFVHKRRLCWSERSPFFINHSSYLCDVHTIPCLVNIAWSNRKRRRKKSHNSRVKIFIWPNQKYTFAPLFNQRQRKIWRRRRRSLLFNVRIHAHGHCKGHQFMYASNDVCVCIKNCLSFLRLILHYLILFWCKNGRKKTIQLALAMAKSILHAVVSEQEREKREKK